MPIIQHFLCLPLDAVACRLFLHSSNVRNFAPPLDPWLWSVNMHMYALPPPPVSIIEAV